MLRHASAVLDEIDQAAPAVHDIGAVRAAIRVGLFPSAWILVLDPPRERPNVIGGSTAKFLSFDGAPALDIPPRGDHAASGFPVANFNR